MMKSLFETPEIEVVIFKSSDIIATGASIEEGDSEVSFDDLT